MRTLLVALGFAISTALAASGTAVAHHRGSFGLTGCVTPTGEFVLTATWNDMRVTHWSYFVANPGGSAEGFEPVPVPGRSGTVSVSLEGDTSTTESVSVSLFRGGGPLRQEVAVGTLTQRPAGWPPCATHNNTFGVTACATRTGEFVVTATWTRMRVTHWSYFVGNPGGNASDFQPVPVPGPSGTVSVSLEGDTAAVESASVSLFRGGGPLRQQLAKATINRPPAGFPTC
jgi:hypothetical protein